MTQDKVVKTAEARAAEYEMAKEAYNGFCDEGFLYFAHAPALAQNIDKEMGHIPS